MEAKPVRILYKEITTADQRKLRAESNDTPSGGGARDLRLPFRDFEDIIRHMLPDSSQAIRTRKGQKVELTVRRGKVKPPKGPEVELMWEPPTSARSAEGRIPRVHDNLQMPQMGRGGVFLVLIQDADGRVGLYYAYEDDLRAGKWNAETAAAILKCKDDPARPKRYSVQGYIDLAEGRNYCHGVDPRA